MLPRSLRLNPKHIASIAYRGVKKSGHYLDVRVREDTRLSEPKFAISISKKIDKRAVVRNRIKRRLRAAIATILTTHSVRPAQYLILVRSSALANIEVNVEGELIKVLGV